MITGVVTADREPIIRLLVHGSSGKRHDVEAVIDTGFDGWLSLPSELIARLGLPWRRRGRAVLADGSESLFDIYEGIVVWDGKPRRIAVDEAEVAPLVGMALLEGYELKMQIQLGGNVSIKRLRKANRG